MTKKAIPITQIREETILRHQVYRAIKESRLKEYCFKSGYGKAYTIKTFCGGCPFQAICRPKGVGHD